MEIIQSFAPPSATLTSADVKQSISKIKGNIEATRAELLRLYCGRAWESLGYANWSEFVEAEIGLSVSQSYREIQTAQIEDRLSPIGENTVNEYQARALMRVPVERQVEVFRAAQEAAGEGKLTARHIRETAERMGLARERWGARAADSTAKDYDEAELRMTLKQFEYAWLRAVHGEKIISLRHRSRIIDDARYMTVEELDKAIDEYKREARHGE